MDVGAADAALRISTVRVADEVIMEIKFVTGFQLGGDATFTLTCDTQEIVILEAAMCMMAHHADQGDPALQDVQLTILKMNELIHEACVDAGLDQEDLISYTT